MRSVRSLSVPGGQALAGGLGLEEPGGHANLLRSSQKWWDNLKDELDYRQDIFL